MRSARQVVLIAVILGGIGILPACSSGKGSSAVADRSQTAGSANVADSEPCPPPIDTTPVKVTPLIDSSSDLDLVSFDATKIRMHWFPHPDASADHPHPTVLMGPGWSLAGATDVKGPSILGSVDIGTLRQAGYNVLTWDPRGFGKSEGTAMVDSVDFEARDVQQMIDWISTLPTVQLDARRDPRMGMVGGSYGGGIQLVSAPIDCRIDALVPIVAWHSLKSSLFKAETIKIGWADALADASAGSSVDRHVTNARQEVDTTGTISEENKDWFISRGPGDLVARINAPTLLAQGTVDTLFTLDEAVTNYRILKKNDVPTAMLWFCDGHGVCLTDAGDQDRLPTATVKWLDRYVKRDKSVDTGPEFSLIDQNGVEFNGDGLGPSSGDPLRARGSGVLDLTAAGGAGPATIPADNPSPLAGLVGGLTVAAASNAVEVPISAAERDVLVVGAPKLTISYRGKSGSGDKPQRVFAQLVDDSTGLVVGNQITPVQIVLDGKRHSTEVPLEMIAFSMKSGSALTLQVVATTVAYAEPQMGGQIDFDKIQIELPVDSSLKRSK